MGTYKELEGLVEDLNLGEKMRFVCGAYVKIYHGLIDDELKKEAVGKNLN